MGTHTDNRINHAVTPRSRLRISIDYQDIVNISLNIFTTQGMHTTQKAGNPTCRPVNIFHKNFKFSPYFIYQDA